MDGLPFFEYLSAFSEDLILGFQNHLLLSVQILVVATGIGVVLGMLVYRNKFAAAAALGALATWFTIPSIALLGLFVPLLGAGLITGFPVITMYGLLPVLRNTIAGLNSVDAATLDSARGIGMGRFRILWQIELPLAWPVILTGIRVSGQLIVGLVAIAAYVQVAGLGEMLYGALTDLGSVNTFNEALAGTLLVAIIALLLDAAFVLVRRFSTPKGIRV
ncbi:MAG: ABC transporter permease [Actinomycetota bacterium]|nr:ABC transporter permease [Actinomycetota bacterium]